MEIKTEDLERCFKEIINKLRGEQNIDLIEIDTDYYQLIPTNQWDNWEDNWDNFGYNGKPDVGSLFDDIESLKKMSNDQNIPCTYADFDRVSSVLRAISQEYCPI